MIFDCNIQIQYAGFQLNQQFQSADKVVGLFGQSGTGKTTILHSLAGIIKPQHGHIRIQDQTWFDAKDQIYMRMQQRRVGMVFQDAQLFPHLSVTQNLLYGYRRIAKQEQQFQLDDVVDLLKLSHLLKRMPFRLSGGEKQRVALGRAILYSPKLLLLDEPLSALDTQHKADILPFFQSVRDTLQLPMLYVSHDADEIAQLTQTLWKI